MQYVETARLIVKPTTDQDFESMYTLFTDAEVMRYIGKGIKTREETEDTLNKIQAHQKKHGFSLGSVFEKESGQFVGRAGLIYLGLDDTQTEIEVGYALLKSFWNKGYATELTKALINWGFQYLALNKIVAVIRPENNRSRKVLEKSGLHYLGKAMYQDIEVAKYEIYKSQLDMAKIKLVAATLNDYPILQNMGRLYVYDMSIYLGKDAGWELPSDGLYECIDFKKYWQTTDCYPFLIYYQNEIAGFAIIDKKGSYTDTNYNMAQFFIINKFKNHGIGRYIAELCFNLFPGQWEIMVIPGNEGAYRFWRNTISHYTKNRYTEITCPVAHFDNKIKNIFIFTSQK